MTLPFPQGPPFVPFVAIHSLIQEVVFFPSFLCVGSGSPEDAGKDVPASRFMLHGRDLQIYCDKFSTTAIFPIPRSMQTATHKPTYTLARAKVGERLRVVTICPDCPECLRLRELGFQDRVEVRKVADGAAIICSIMGMRVAIGRDLGEHVRVEKIAA